MPASGRALDGHETAYFDRSKRLLPEGTPAVAEYYDTKKTWPADSLERRAALRAKRA